MSLPSSFTQAQRRRAVALAVALTRGTQLEPSPYERQLLTRFEAGELTLDEVTDLLEQRVYQLLYHSRATAPLGEAELLQLLTWSRTYNAAHGITGLLLYSEGYFVQVLEGEEAAVTDVYAHIQRDPRHAQVRTVRQGPGPRRFAEWSMGFGLVAPPALAQTLQAIEHPEWPFRVPEVSDQHLLALLEAFA